MFPPNWRTVMLHGSARDEEVTLDSVEFDQSHQALQYFPWLVPEVATKCSGNSQFWGRG